MEMCYKSALVMPQKYQRMNSQEQQDIVGGSKNVTISRNFLDKSYCTMYAAYMLRQSLVTGMMDHEIAEELFAHAVCYYDVNKVAAVSGFPIAYYCYCNAADGIAIMDGGDSVGRKAFYKTVWELF